MGKTFCTLFSAFKKEELCQLFIYPTIPDVDFCNSYYRITDKDVLNFFKTFKVTGKEIHINTSCEVKHNLFENAKDELFYRNKKNHTASRVLARDFLWKVTPWFNQSLKDWLKREKISHIFVAPGGYKFIYDIAIKCADFLKIPIITYICDEYFFVSEPKRIIEKVKEALFKRKMNQLMMKTSLIITISEELKRAYADFFRKDTHVVMTGCSFPIEAAPQRRNVIKELTYMGNIRNNRFVSLCEIGMALDEINQELNQDFSLNIYTKENDATILRELSKCKSIKMKGFVTGESFYRVFHSSQCLLHTEGFDEKSVDYVKNSISTKLADSLGSGILLVAYGPSNIASIRHLIVNNSAFVISNNVELKQKLRQLFSLSESERMLYVENALCTASKCHNTDLNGRILYQIIENV